MLAVDDVDQMLEEGLVVFSDVDIIKYAYRALDAEPGKAAVSLEPGVEP